MFWKKPPPIPWYKKLWTKFESVVYGTGVIATAVIAIVNYIQIDTTQFENTTAVAAVTDTKGNLIVSVEPQTELPEMAYIIVSLNGNQLEQNIYPYGIERGEIIMQSPLPFNYINREYFDVTVDIIFKGPRTILSTKRLSTVIEVENNYERITTGASLVYL